MSEKDRAYRARNLRYKRAALASMGFESILSELNDMRETCDTIQWWTDQDDETLLNALDGDDEDIWEFKMAFGDLETKADSLFETIYELSQEDHFEQTYDDCTVALIGNRYRTIGFDGFEEDYYALTSYESELAQTESGKRLMRKTKTEMIATIGQCLCILIAFLDLRQQYDYLKATFDILRDENTSLLQQMKEIDAAYEALFTADWVDRPAAEKRFDQLLATLPDRVWIE